MSVNLEFMCVRSVMGKRNVALHNYTDMLRGWEDRITWARTLFEFPFQTWCRRIEL